MDSPYFFEETNFWSVGDERAHFEWLDRIAAVKSVRGQGSRLYLAIDTECSFEDFLELEGIYRRYDGDLSQLEKLKTKAVK